MTEEEYQIKANAVIELRKLSSTVAFMCNRELSMKLLECAHEVEQELIEFAQSEGKKDEPS